MSRIISSEEVEESLETLVKADAIRKDQELMREVQPAFDAKIKALEESKSLKGLWDAGKKKAREEEDAEEQKKMDSSKLSEDTEEEKEEEPKKSKDKEKEEDD